MKRLRLWVMTLNTFNKATMARIKVVTGPGKLPVQATDQTLFDLWKDCQSQPLESVQIQQRENPPVTIQRGDILSFQHSPEDRTAPEWVGRADAFKRWDQSTSKHHWHGEPFDLINVHWLRKVKGPKYRMFDYRSTEEAQWRTVGGTKIGIAWDVQRSHSVSGRIDAQVMGNGNHYWLRGKRDEIRIDWESDHEGEEVEEEEEEEAGEDEKVQPELDEDDGHGAATISQIKKGKSKKVEERPSRKRKRSPDDQNGESQASSVAVENAGVVDAGGQENIEVTLPHMPGPPYPSIFGGH
ncbi:MAG: hypothetical protein Q9162_005749 [Coniocarpon cinnabarinum]